MHPGKLITQALSAVPLPLVLVDKRGHLIWNNELALDLFPADMRGLHYAAVLRQPGVLEAIEASLQDGKRRLAPYLHSGRQRELTYRAVCGACPDLDGEPGAVLISFENISHVEEASQMRQDFVANVSHELRSPLTALLGFVETLRGAAKDDPQARARFLAIMEREATRMNRLVGDLLSLSQVEAGEHQRPTGIVDIAALIRSCVTVLKPMAQDAGAVVTVEGAAVENMSDPVQVAGDSDQLQQVFTNLIENAIKYGRDENAGAAEVRIRLSVLENGPTGPVARIEVTDQGPGISAIHLPRLTERFYRADTHRSRELGGTGLGLAIVKHIVSRHQGRLRISSTPGKGSCFTVDLPLADDGKPA